MDWHIQKLREIRRKFFEVTCRALYYERVIKPSAAKWANLSDEKLKGEIETAATAYTANEIGEIVDRSPINITEAQVLKAEPYSIVIVKTQRPLEGAELQHMVDFFARHGREDLVLMNMGPNDTLQNLRRDQAKRALAIVLGLDDQARKVQTGEMTRHEFDDELSKVLDEDDFDAY